MSSPNTVPASRLEATGPTSVFAAQLDSALVRQLPYHFARAKGVLAARRVGDAVEVWVRPGVTAAALSEARRALGLAVRTLMLTPELFERRLAQLYTKDAGGAEGLIDDLSEHVDLKSLADGLPEVTDLLDAQDDAPVIRFINAFIYPALVTIVAVAVVIGLLVYVVPQVVQVFQNTSQALPFLTRALIALSDFLRVYGGFVVIALAGAATALRAALAVPSLRGRWHGRLLRLPVVGPLVRGLNTARLAATLAILVGSRVPLLVSLRAGAGVVSNVPMRTALDEAAARVQEGASLSRSLGASRLFPPLMVHMIASGEASGRLADMLERTAIQQTRELERRIAAFVALLEPLLILAMGAVVLAIVLAILLPIFELNQIVR